MLGDSGRASEGTAALAGGRGLVRRSAVLCHELSRAGRLTCGFWRSLWPGYGSLLRGVSNGLPCCLM